MKAKQYLRDVSTPHRLARAGVIAALYVGITYVLAPVSFGPLQFRAAEALSVLPVLYPEAVPALYVGVLIANLFGGLGPWDIFGGSLVTLLAAAMTYAFRRSWLAYLWPVMLNGLLVSLYLHVLYSVPYWLTVAYISLSEAAVVVLLGLPLIGALRRWRGPEES
ncbi:MAG: QueT transporter family protein [Firmicutes bacterium]|nr:QueT transporter family protein [Bacillota bacterium]